MIWLKRVLSLLLLTLWGIPWLAYVGIFAYGMYVLKPPFSPEETEFFGRLMLNTVFVGMSATAFSTVIFIVILYLIPTIPKESKGIWLRRFTFSYITAIPKFWYRHIWSSDV